MRYVLVVEDHEEMRDWLSGVALDAFPASEVVRATTIAQAEQRLVETRFNLALIDISLPDGSGIDLIAGLSAAGQTECYPVVATIYDDDQHLFAALEAGAKGYLLKDERRERMVEQLRGVVRGEPPLSPSIARRILRYFRRPAPKPAKQQDLSEREVEVLRLLSRGFNRNDIANVLGITPNTVAGYVKGIYRKLNVSGRAEATLQAVKLGLVDSDR